MITLRSTTTDQPTPQLHLLVLEPRSTHDRIERRHPELMAVVALNALIADKSQLILDGMSSQLCVSNSGLHKGFDAKCARLSQLTSYLRSIWSGYIACCTLG